MSTVARVLHGGKAHLSLPVFLMLAVCLCLAAPPVLAADQGDPQLIRGVDATQVSASQAVQARDITPAAGPSGQATLAAKGIPEGPQFVPDEIIFKLRLPGDNRSERAVQALERVAAKHKLKRSESLFNGNARGRLKNIYRSKLPAGVSPLDAAAKMKDDPDVEWAEPNYLAHACAVPTDPTYPSQWHLPKISAPAAWDVTTGSQAVVVAILDTGVQMNHPDLDNRIWTNTDEQVGDANGDGFPGVAGVDDDGDGKIDEDSAGRQPGEAGYTNDLKDDDDENGFVDDIHGYDFVSVSASKVYPGEDPAPRDNNPSDVFGHGTHCAGIVGAEASDQPGQIGVAGVNWNVSLMPVRAGYKDAGGNGVLEYADIAAGAEYAAENGADIISMSFGGPDSTLMTSALENAYEAGATLIAAAGNSATDQKSYPGALPCVLAVAATQQDDLGTYFTNFGSWVGVAAPGLGIWSTVPTSTYEAWSGTSMATPIVAGIAALCLAHTPTLTNDEIYQILKSTTDPVQGNVYLGLGRVNAAAALDKTSIAIAQLDPALDDLMIPVAPVPINGTTSSQYSLYYGIGVYPDTWTQISTGGPITNGLLGTFDINQIHNVSDYISIRLVVDEGLPTEAEDRAVFWVEVWDDTGYLPGWPQTIPPVNGYASAATGSPIVADLNRDGTNEVFAISDNGQACLWEPDGTIVPGWPKTLYGGIHNDVSVAVANVDGGDDLELIVPMDFSSTYDCKVSVWKFDGSTVPGWPQSMGPGYYPMGQYVPGGPAMAGDINGDGQTEVICSTYSYYDDNAPMTVYAWHPDGTLVTGWPLTFDSPTNLWPRHTIDMALADLDDNGSLDVVIPHGSFDGGPKVTVVDGAGNALPGWPVSCGGDPWGASVGDLQGDGYPEIVVGTDNGVYAFDRSGSAPQSWAGYQFQGVHATPALGDLNGDGNLEIAFQDTESRLNVCNKDCVLLPGWPQLTGQVPTSGWRFEFSQFPGTTIADINGDSQPDILCGGVASSKLYAFDMSGTPIAGFPKFVGYVSFRITVTTPEITDVDGNGESDIVMAGLNGKIYIWETGSPINDCAAEWPRLGNEISRQSLYVPCADGPVVRVSATGSDSNDGSSWGVAKRTIQAAVDASPVDGEIWVAAGVYNEHVSITKPVRLYGGLVGDERGLLARSWRTHPSIIDSQDTGTAVTVQNVASSAVRIDGFTVRSTPNGAGAGVSCGSSTLVLANDNLSHNHAMAGGGLSATDSAITLDNCTVEYNTAGGAGGVNLVSCTGAITGCRFNNNIGQVYGGALRMDMSNVSIAGSVFSNNSAGAGGAIVLYEDGGSGITDCTFTGNTCDGTGGAIYNEQSNSGAVARCTFTGNQAETGGGIYLQGSSPLIAQTVFLNNSADTYGGAIHCDSASAPSIQNCVMRGNSGANGAGIGCTESVPAVVNNTIIGNTGAGFYTNGGSSALTNNIIAFNTQGVTAVGGATPIFSHNDVYGNGTYDYSTGLTPDNGSISADPAIADVDGGDYAIGGDSPCIDAGTDTGAPVVDLHNRERPQDGNGDGTVRTDIGATEFKCWFVKYNSPGPMDGTSWANAFHYIQQAMSVAQPGDEVWVAAGEYGAPIQMADGVKLYGGLIGNELSRKDRDWKHSVTTINGHWEPASVTFSVTEDPRTRVDGFKFISGPAGQCTGVLAENGAVGVIENNTFVGNAGGGIQCQTGAAVTITGNTITLNSSDNGAGVYINGASPIIRGNLITGNTAQYRGGGVYCDGAGTPVVSSNIITGNSASNGAGFYLGMGATGAIVTNNTITGNNGVVEGGGIFMDYNSLVAIQNNIITNNTGYGISYYADDGCGRPSGDPCMRNNDLYANQPADYFCVNPGQGDISQDPLFVNAAAGDFHITGSSPCLNAGYNDAFGLPALDMDYQPRVSGSAVDIGADEYLILRVSTGGSDLNNGLTWPLAKRTVAGAIAATGNGPAEIWVASGTYDGGITLPDRVSLFGGFAGNEIARDERDWAANVSALDGSAVGRVITVADGATRATWIDGFTIKNGITIDGGGIYCANGASPTIQHNLITGNDAQQSPALNGSGGGVYCGGGSQALVQYNRIEGNRALFGGGVYADASSSPAIVNNIIRKNTAAYESFEAGAGGWGGGIYTAGASTITNNTIVGNTRNNFAGGVGGGIYIAGGSPSITNNIVAFNDDGISALAGSTPTLTYNDVCGNTAWDYSAGLTPGEGSFSADPRLASVLYGDMHIQEDSPCRGSGTNSVVQPDWVDMDGQPRVQPTNGTVDIGADETDGTHWDYIIHVSINGNDANDGLTWFRSKRTVQAGIDAAAGGKEVWVAGGTYIENLTLANRVALYGGFDTDDNYRDDRDSTYNVTTLQGIGGGSGPVVTIRNATDAANCIDGFTITGGDGVESTGAGVYCESSTLTVENNTITANNSMGECASAGGLYVAGSNITIRNNVIKENSSSFEGGGILVAGSSGQIVRNTITGNAAFFGGGIYCVTSSNVFIQNNVIAGNSALVSMKGGGGIYCGSCSPMICNNTIVANTAPSQGGGISLESSSAVIESNIIAFGNSGVYADSASHPVANWNDVYGNTNYNYQGITPLQDDISADPQLADRSGGNYHILSLSPCIDKALSNGAGVDRDGNARPTDGDGSGTAAWDIGAYEYQPGLATLRKSVPNGTEVDLWDVIVTACFPNAESIGQHWVYVENRDRTSGIRLKTTATCSIGDIVNVSGTMETDTVRGERYVNVDPSTLDASGGGPVLGPLGMRTEWAGGGASGVIPAIKDGFGFYNTGMLVQTWGLVMYRNTTERYVYIDDGSDLYDGSTYRGIKVMIPSGLTMPGFGQYAKITGISSAQKIGDNYVRVMRVRNQNDIQIVTDWFNDPMALTQGRWNMLSLPGIARYPNAENVFISCETDPPVVLEGNLKSYDPLDQAWRIYASCTGYPNCLVSEGYGLYIPLYGSRCFDFERTAVTSDQLISLPRGSSPVGFLSFIGNPFDYDRPWSSIRVTDGNSITSLPNAVSIGWIHKVEYWTGNTWWPVSNLATGNMSERTGYLVYPKVDNLALIVPAQ